MAPVPVEGLPRRSLWRNADFGLLWLAQTISQLGSQVSRIALPLTAILALQAGPVQVGLLTAVEFLPFLVFGLLAGAWVDRHRRRHVLILADAGRALALGTIPAAYALGVLDLALLYPVAFVTGTLTVFFDVAHQSYLPSLVRPDQLVDGNAKLELSASVAEVSGPGLGGLLVQLLRAPLAVLADAASYLCSMVLLILIRTPERPPAAPADGERPTLRRDIAEGLRLVLRDRRLRLIVACTALSNLSFGGIILSLLLLYSIRVLHLNPAELGVVVAIGNAGALLAAFTANRITRRIGLGRALSTAVGIASLAALLIPLSTPDIALPVLIVALVGANFGGVLYNINQVSLRQAITPEHLLGRMNASVRFVVWGAIPVGAVLAGVLGDQLGLRPAIWIGAVLGLAAIVPTLRAPLHRLTDIERAAAAT